MKAHLILILMLQKLILQKAKQAVIQKLQTTKHKATSLTQFDGHFDKTCNTAICNIVTKPDSKHLSYNKLIQKCSYADTIPVP